MTIAFPGMTYLAGDAAVLRIERQGQFQHLAFEME